MKYAIQQRQFGRDENHKQGQFADKGKQDDTTYINTLEGQSSGSCLLGRFHGRMG
jgi:hypothetical protein